MSDRPVVYVVKMRLTEIREAWVSVEAMESTSLKEIVQAAHKKASDGDVPASVWKSTDGFYEGASSAWELSLFKEDHPGEPYA